MTQLVKLAYFIDNITLNKKIIRFLSAFKTHALNNNTYRVLRV